MMAKFIYIVGAQCTGKTTLSHALYEEIRARDKNAQVEELAETARRILHDRQFTRDDVREGLDRCMLLQKLVLESQFEHETSLAGKDIVVSDRSGADPLVYALIYGGEKMSDELASSEAWNKLRANMQKSTVIVSPPVREWLVDDGTRLMPSSWEEWLQIHESFCSTLRRFDIDFIELPGHVKDLGDRIDYVLRQWRGDKTGND
jgi:predicted ATPase